QAMYDKDITTALQLLDELIQHGKDPGRFVYDLIYFLRDVLLYKSAPTLGNLRERAMIDEAFEKLTTMVQIDWLQQAMMQLNQCQQEIKWTNNPKLFIEIAILSITNQYQNTNGQATEQTDTDVVAKLTNRLAKLEKDLTTLKQTPATEAPNSEVRRPTRR